MKVNKKEEKTCKFEVSLFNRTCLIKMLNLEPFAFT